MTINDECSIVRDLLPIYIENECSDNTKIFVRTHLEDCNDCNTVFNNMKSEMPFEQGEIAENLKEISPLKKIKKINDRKIKIFSSLLVVCILLLGFWFKAIGFASNSIVSYKPVKQANKLSEVLINSGVDAFVDAINPVTPYNRKINVSDNKLDCLVSLTSDRKYKQTEAFDTKYYIKESLKDEFYVGKPSTKDGQVLQERGIEVYIEYCFTNKDTYKIVIDEDTFDKHLSGRDDLIDCVSEIEIDGIKYYMNSQFDLSEKDKHIVKLTFPGNIEKECVNNQSFINQNFGSCALFPESLYDYFKNEYIKLDRFYADYKAEYIKYGFDAFAADEKQQVKETLKALIADNGKIIEINNRYPAWVTDVKHVMGSIVFENGKEAYMIFDIGLRDDISVRNINLE